jgi:hypothetical protein
MKSKDFKVTARGLEPLYFDSLGDALLGCARLRVLGYRPTLVRKPKPETISLVKWQAERGI